MTQLTPAAQVEVHEIVSRAQVLARGGQSDRKQADALLSDASTIRKSGLSSDEARRKYSNAVAATLGLPETDYSKKAQEQRHCEKVFREFLSGRGDAELRDMSVGSESISYTQGADGGFLVPQSFYDSVILGMTQLSPLLDPANVTIRNSDNGRPMGIAGMDLTGITSTIIGENTKTVKAAPPTMTQKMLGAYTFKTSPIGVGLEFEQDSFVDVMQLLATAFSVGLARGASVYLANGTGISQPTGLVVAAGNPGVQTALPTVIDVDELLSVYHSVDSYHRNSPKCAWVFSDPQWRLIKQTAAHLGGSGLSSWKLALEHSGDETLFGKKVLLDPNFSSGPSSKFVFGDLAYYAVRIGGGMRVRRNMETQIEFGEALYTAQLRVDSNLIAVGNDTPVVCGIFSS